MAKRIVKYNPAFLSKEELVSSFVVRHAELELIVQVLRENVTNSNQHVLVIGPRGIGKTMLALRVVEEIRKEKDLGKRWYPLVFSEESYPVTTPGEFWLEALFHLGQQTGDDRWKQTYHELGNEKDENRLRERALAQLMDFADSEGKRILLVVENFNMLVGEQMHEDHGWTLRHTLLNESRVMLLATATSRFEEIDNCGKAMFELFRTLDLKPLDEGECRTLWNCVTGEELSDERIRPLQILTGGNPRLLAIISTFASKMSFRELMDDLMQLVDDHTEYFKGYLDNLPAVERKTFLALADLWDPATAREVADAARLGVSKTSALLRRLTERGAVVLANGQKRTKLYQVAERMYNIYYLMRRRGAPSRRVKAVVNFMVSFYEEKKLVSLTQRIAEEACGLEPGIRKEHLLAYEAIVESTESDLFRSKLIKGVPHDFFEMDDAPHTIKCLVGGQKLQEMESDKANLREVFEEGKALEDSSEFEKAESVYRRAIEINPESERAWARLGFILHEKLGRYAEAEEAYRRAIELDPDGYCTWIRFGQLLYRRLGRYEEAEKAYNKGVELQPNCPLGWRSLGDLLTNRLGRYEEAENAYRKAIEIDEKNAGTWTRLGLLLHEKLERYDEAEKAYKKAVELSPDDHWAWEQFGRFLHYHRKRYVEAEEAYRKAIDLGFECCLVWGYLGELLGEYPERYEEAEKAYRKAIEINEEYAWAWAGLSRLLHEKIERYDEAEKAYRQVTELKPQVAWGHAKLGFLLHEKLERYEEAETSYRKALELKSDDPCCWYALIDILDRRLGRYEEAAEMCRKAIDACKELDDKHHVVYIWGELIFLLLDKLGLPEEGLKLTEECLARYRKNPHFLNVLAWAFCRHGGCDYLARAEAWAKEALELAPEHKGIRGTLTSILSARGKGKEALEHLEKFLSDPSLVEEYIEEAIDQFIGIAASGYGREALEMLRESPSAEILEPLVVGLRMYVGEDVKAAEEIMEVGRDVVKRIEERREKMQAEEASENRSTKK